MKRTTVLGTWGLIGFGAVALVYGLYWFYRIPPAPVASDGYQLVESGATGEGIPSIDHPEFESVAAADQYLNDDGEGVDVELNGVRRFYPYQILVWHEAVNDDIGGTPVLVTYSPLTGTGMVFLRSTGEEAPAFSTNGKLWNSNTVLTDSATGSTWIQLIGRAVDGPRAGTTLEPVPARVMTWRDWKAAYPRGDVLSRETGASRDYTRNPYGTYAATPAIWFPLTFTDARLDAKTPVFVVSVGEERAAYPADVLAQVREVRETIAGIPVEIAYDEELGTAFAHRLELDGDPGEELAVTRGFWFAWAAAYPGIHLYELP